MTQVTITRHRLYPVPGFGTRVKWNYAYSVDGAAPITYGPRLGDLRDRLRVKHPDARIICEWQS